MFSSDSLSFADSAPTLWLLGEEGAGLGPGLWQGVPPPQDPGSKAPAYVTMGRPRVGSQGLVERRQRWQQARLSLWPGN